MKKQDLSLFPPLLLYQQIYSKWRSYKIKINLSTCFTFYFKLFLSKFDEQRNVKEDTANEEFEISVNGPNLAHCDTIIIEALNLYWAGKPWRFNRTSLDLHQHWKGSSLLKTHFQFCIIGFIKTKTSLNHCI